MCRPYFLSEALIHFDFIFNFLFPIYSPPGLLQVLVIHFSCYLSIRFFYYVLSVSIFYSKIVLFPLHPVVDLSTDFIGRIFFVILEELVLFALLDPLLESFESCFFHQYF